MIFRRHKMSETFIIYKTTNNINGKFYIGKHKVQEKYDYLYLGSGHAISKAIKKYGAENFTRETLYVFDNEEDCILKEREIVSEDMVCDPLCYNIATGGNAGKSHSDTTKKLISKAVTEEWKDNDTRKLNARKSSLHRHEKKTWGVCSYKKDSREKISKNTSNYWSDPEHREYRSKAISESLKGRKLSKEHIENSRNGQNKTKYCKFCNKHHKLAAYARWHGDRCKSNKENA